MNLYTAAQTRELDRLTIEGEGIAGIRLMARAGRAALQALLERWPQVECLHIFCGAGNNGGDGYIVAELAQQRGIPVQLYQLPDPDRVTGDAALARQRALAAGVVINQLGNALPALTGGVVVDALLGTGLNGAVREQYAAVINHINASQLPVMALDIPSGLCSDTGCVLGVAIVAAVTITFIGRKQGLYTAAGPEHCGPVEYADLSVPVAVFEQVPASVQVMDIEQMLAPLSPRPLNSHKGMFGNVLVVGGDIGMGGAALMAGEAAARCGAGLVSVATRAEHVAAIITRCPEIMARGVQVAADMGSLLQRATVVAVGPGLGTGPWSEQMFCAAALSAVPQVLDADALTLLASGRLLEVQPRANRVITPHPGEAARLLGINTAEVQADRFAAVQALQQRYGGVVVLKGVGSLVCDGQNIWLSPYGNPGMASGGMGDVLTGVIAALLGQGLSPPAAACAGVCLHGRAADLAAQEGGRGLLATDLLPLLRALVDTPA
ncbi:NAD(P)H-hydrate dehydratase [Halieaceae bacterium IMCC14734]|uniref:Bifunctional NAD(P)H-hydrate repair enzyme n=1 Tax=Candidatus Litorirhabdus singularis TaxID=2518993 RepID=A0ABT3TKF5_9GAMM|nr:NAD(P)H-hydrate dehydratase [Candidatus Litorirhabdus singularis]MCX2982725.1 NAD(P)H-hydrate dehydratase [Candidatus Litorirhabdus singularis]